MNTIEELNVDGYDAMVREIEKDGYLCEEKADGGVYIKTPKSKWRLKENNDGTVDLYHQNMKKDTTKYHFQKECKNFMHAYNYLRHHDLCKYTKYENSHAISHNKRIEYLFSQI